MRNSCLMKTDMLYKSNRKKVSPAADYRTYYIWRAQQAHANLQLNRNRPCRLHSSGQEGRNKSGDRRKTDSKPKEEMLYARWQIGPNSEGICPKGSMFVSLWPRAYSDGLPQQPTIFCLSQLISTHQSLKTAVYTWFIQIPPILDEWPINNHNLAHMIFWSETLKFSIICNISESEIMYCIMHVLRSLIQTCFCHTYSKASLLWFCFELHVTMHLLGVPGQNIDFLYVQQCCRANKPLLWPSSRW